MSSISGKCPADIGEVEKAEKERIERNLALAKGGVKFIDIRTAYIDDDVQIGKGTLIYPLVTLEGSVKIGEDCIIGQNTRIVDSEIGDRTEIHSSVIIESKVGSETKVGPFAYMRPNSTVGDGCKVGDFVEIKNSSMGDGAKASHLTYIGDSDVGGGVNLGCGVVFVNFDGSRKYRSTVGEGAFIGCNSNLISPVNIGEKAYIAAGSTITEDVPPGALYIDRGKAAVKEGWVEKKDILTRKK